MGEIIKLWGKVMISNKKRFKMTENKRKNRRIFSRSVEARPVVESPLVHHVSRKLSDPKGRLTATLTKVLYFKFN